MKSVGWLSFKAVWLTVLLLASSLTLGVLGLVTAEWRVQHAEKEMRAEFQRQANQVASSINPGHVAALSFRNSDRDLPAFNRICEQFEVYSQESSVSDIYGLVRRGNTLAYGPAFFSGNAPTPVPGSSYPSSTQDLTELLSSGIRDIVEADKNYITAVAPVFDPKTKEVLMTVVLDMPLELWQENLLRVRLVPVEIALLLLALQFFGAGAIYLRSSLAPKKMRHLETVLAASFGLLLTGVITYFVMEAEDRDRRLAFMDLAEAKAESVEENLRTVQLQLSNIGSYIENVATLDAAAFTAFATPLLNNKSIESCFWTMAIAAGDKAEHELFAQGKEYADYNVFQYDSEGNKIPSDSTTGNLYPVYYVEPPTQNVILPGLDLGSIPEERVAIETANRSRLVTASIPDMDKMLDSPEKSVFVYISVFAKGESGELLLRGLVGVKLRFDLAMRHALSGVVQDSSRVSMKMYQIVTNQEAPIPIAHETGKTYNERTLPEFFNLTPKTSLTLMHSMFALSHTYAVIVEPTAYFFAAHPMRNSYATALIAFFTTVVLTIFISILRNQQSTLEARIWESTIEVRERSETFRRLFSESTDPILLLRQGKISDCNNATLRLLKYGSKQYLLGHSPEDISPPTQPDGRPSKYAFKEMVGFCVQKGHHAFEWTHLRHDGTLVPVETMFTLITIRGENHIHVIWRDITERKLAEAALRSSEEKYRSLVDSLPIGLYRYTPSPEEKFVMVNKAMVKIHGSASAEELMAYPVADLYVNAEDRADLWREIEESGFVAGKEVQIRRKDGTIIWGSISGRVLLNAEGEIEYFDGSIMDITERKQAAEQRMEMERRLLHSQKLESLGVLAGGIAHDFNNLLAVVLGNLEVAADQIRKVPEAQECVSKAVSAARRAAALTDQMLAYSGKGRFVVKAVNLSIEVEENLHILRASISKDVKLDLHLEEELPPIYADEGQIQQIVMNLITNASEAIGANAGTITISTGVVTCTAEDLQRSQIGEKPEPGDFIFLEIHDTGCGMDEETKKRVFDPFFTTKFTGRGLGMSAVLGIMQGHLGALEMQSEAGKGTTVRVLFPVAEPPEDLPVAMAYEPDEAQPAERAKIDEWSGLFLVVDDEAPLRELGAKVLGRFGFDTITASDGQEAVEIFKEKSDQITAVLLDLTMPRMDGVAAFEAMRKIKPGVKVILCSGFSEHEAKQRFSGQGLAGYVHKPYRITTLRAEIEKVMKGHGNLM